MASSSQYLIVDIETVPDRRIWQPAKEDPSVFPPLYAHRVIVLGGMLLDSNYRLVKLGLLAPPGTDESDRLRSFSTFVEAHQPTLVTYNGRGFDLPVLALRSLRCGVPMAWYYKNRGEESRYCEENHIDLCD